MPVPASNTYPNYLISHLTSYNHHIYLIRSTGTNQDLWLTSPSLKYALSYCKLKILQLIYQDKKVELTKKDILQNLIQGVQQFQLTKSRLELITRCQRYYLHHMESNFNDLFDSFKLSLFVTPYLWKNCFRLIKQPLLFEVVGRKFNKKTSTFQYLIKYKYFENHQHLMWVRTSAFHNHPAKKIIQNFDYQNPYSENLLLHKKYSQYKKQLKQKLRKKQKIDHQILIGKGRIKQATFYLRKQNQQSLESVQWHMIYATYFPHNKISQINAKIKRNHHDCDLSPFIDRQLIKKLILQEISKSPQKKQKCKQKKLSEQNIQTLVDQKVQLFMINFQRLKKEIESYCEGIQIFDKFSDSVKVSTLRQKIHSKIQELENNQINGHQQNDSFQYQKETKQEDFIKQQFGSDTVYESDSEVKQEHFDQSQQGQQVKYQNSMSENQQTTKKQQSQTDPQDFYKRIKREYNDQDTQSKYFKNQRKISQKVNDSQIVQKNLNLMKKKMKKKTKAQDSFLTDDQSQVKKEEVSTTSQLSTEVLTSKKQEQNQTQKQKQEFSQTKKIKKVQKFLNSVNSSYKVYRLQFQDGQIVYGTQSELLEKQGINFNTFEKMKDL